jgi:hypothetical protein
MLRRISTTSIIAATCFLMEAVAGGPQVSDTVTLDRVAATVVSRIWKEIVSVK